MWPFNKREPVHFGTLNIAPDPPPLEQYPEQEITITYMLGDKPQIHKVQGKLLYFSTPFNGLSHTPDVFTYFYGNREQHRALFTVATSAIVTIETTKR